MRTRRQTTWLRLLGIVCLLLSSPGCDDPTRHGTATLVDLGEFTWHTEWASHGQYLLALSGVERNPPDGETPEYRDYRLEHVTAHQPGTWEVVGEARSEKHLSDVFSCGDPNVVMVNDGGDPFDTGGYRNDFSLYRLDTGGKIKEFSTYGFYNCPHSERTWFPYTYECDVGANVMYMRWASNEIAALDGSTGEVLRSFIDPGEPLASDDAPSFFIQPDRDRLVWTERHPTESEVRIYRLSNAELVGAIQLIPTGIHSGINDYLRIGQDHLAVFTDNLGELCAGTGIRLIDLAEAAIESTSCIRNPYYNWTTLLSQEPPLVMVSVQRMPQECQDLIVVDLATGTQTPTYDLCDLNQGGFGIYPEIGRAMVSERAPDGGGVIRWWMYSWPSFELLGEGRLDHYYDSSILVPDRGIFSAQSYYVDTFAVVDAHFGGIMDEFHFCTGVAESALRIDPTGRWASTRCFGDWSEVVNPEDKPRGAGFAAVDLEQYRDW
jgi:hypothetical protein